MTKDMVIGRATPANTVVVYPNVQELFEHIKPSKKVKVATGCPLCDEIWSSKEAYQESVGDPFYENIVIIMQNDEPHLYIPGFSVLYMQINYCPKCGRRLVEE